MSEHQIVKFRAIDRPLTEQQLELMSRQSSRAKFSKWEFDVDYQYSSFGGNVDEMLRNGYDVYLSFSNYGGSEVRIRLPAGLPFAQNSWSQYLSGESTKWIPDKSGKAGILVIAPRVEQISSVKFELEAYIDAAAQLRDMLMNADLRALYLIWLCDSIDYDRDPKETLEPPVPHGLADTPERARELLDYFDVDPLIVDAAADGVPDSSAGDSHAAAVESWLNSLGDSRRTAILRRLFAEDPVGLKAELLATVRDCQGPSAWPTSPPSRLLSELLEKCEALRKAVNQRRRRAAADRTKHEAEKAENQRLERIASMRAKPEEWIAKAAELTAARGNENYYKAAEILAEVRDAIGGPAGRRLARKHAQKLVEQFPTMHVLKSAMRKQDLVD